MLVPHSLATIVINFCIIDNICRREIDSALVDRDRALKENHELREKLGEREKSTGLKR
jgi:hypothetical protein